MRRGRVVTGVASAFVTMVCLGTTGLETLARRSIISVHKGSV